MNFFTSDIHFNDVWTMTDGRRPFQSTRQQDNFIIKQFNNVAGENDTIYCVGDLLDCDYPESVGWRKALTYIKRIKANIVLIMGNNEQRIVDYFFDGNFEKFRARCKKAGIKEVYKDYRMSFGGYNFFLTHYPRNYDPSAVTLFGHCHRTRGLWASFGLNMACELNYFKPMSEEEILYQLQKKAIYFKDKDYRKM